MYRLVAVCIMLVVVLGVLRSGMNGSVATADDNGDVRISVLETAVSRQGTRIQELQSEIDRINVVLSSAGLSTEDTEPTPGWTYFVFNGNSMSPTFTDGQTLIVDLKAYENTSPQRGDIIVFNPPVSSQQPYIKRSIGVAGDTVEIGSDGYVHLNDTRLEEPYIQGPITEYQRQTCDAVTVPDGELYVLGDNRRNGSDSRIFGTVPVENFIGKVVLE